MNQPDLKAPILFLLFNRPGLTRQVFDAIRKVRPQWLYLAADGPRRDVPGEDQACREVRQIVSAVDWDCEVFTLHHDENLGCRSAVSDAIDWFFEHEAEGIILEDDCVPSRSFFYFCQELLERYRNDSRIMHIAGTNLHFGQTFGEGNYFFSRYNLVWGWATWKRAWACYDVEMRNFPAFKERKDLDGILYSDRENRERMKIYKDVYEGRIETWDYQWHYATRSNNGLAIHPNTNLVQNIGFGAGATHTVEENEKISSNLAREIDSPLIHPSFILANREADRSFYNNNIRKNLYHRTMQSMGGWARKLLSSIKG